QFIGRVDHGVELVVDFSLASCADLVVAALNFEACLVQLNADGVAQVSLLVSWSHWEVAALEWGLVTLVAALFLAAGVPRCLVGIDRVERALWLGFVANVFEDEEFCFWSEERGISDTGGLQVCFCAFCNTTWVAVLWLTGAWVDDREVERQSLFQTERIDETSGYIWDQLHVGIRDAGEAADGGTIEKLAVDEEVGVHGLGWHVEVLLYTG